MADERTQGMADEKKDVLQERIDKLAEQLAEARKKKRARDARERRAAEKAQREARAREAEELLSFLEGHTVTSHGRTMTGVAYIEQLREQGTFSPVSDASCSHDADGGGVSDSRSDSVTPGSGVNIDTLLSDDARVGGDAR